MNSKSFYKEAFAGYNVPANIKGVVIEICDAADIKGICDPMYIANTIAYRLGLGTGSGDFSATCNKNSNNFRTVKELAEEIYYSYGCNKFGTFDVELAITSALSLED